MISVDNRGAGLRLFGCRLFRLVAPILALCLLINSIVFMPALAADATWKDGKLSYDNKTYESAGTISKMDPRVKQAGLTEDSPAYAVQDDGKYNVVFFKKDSDPTKQTAATAVTYDFTPPSTYSNPQKKDISIAASEGAATSDSNPSNPSEGKTSCDGRFTFGIGWIICPFTKLLASSMDWLYGQLSSFLVAQPLQTDPNTTLYRMWDIMRNIANICFVIGFLIIVYSQITTYGVSNYGIKRTLPRLIVAAILVNISYWVCAVAVDLSNFLGYSIHSLFIDMRGGLVGGEGNNWQITWSSMAGFLLAGGTAAAGAGLFLTQSIIGPGVGASIVMLIPLLLGLICAVLIALLIMAARQALITILVIISPLAFVAYLLPNTEKYFDKWRESFSTLLLLFPIFSVIFGGAQLAGMAIIQSAYQTNSFIMILLGMGVQVAPVVITPFLIKFSGSMIGRLAGLMNNPKRGIVDRSRNWAEKRASEHGARVKAGYDENKVFAALNRRTRAKEMKNRSRDGLKAMYERKTASQFSASNMGRQIDQANRDIEADERLTKAINERSYAKRLHSDQRYIRREIDTRRIGDQVKSMHGEDDARYEELKAGVNNYHMPQTAEMDAIMHQLQDTTREVALNGMRKANADQKQLENLSQDVKNNEAYQIYAGGIQGESGALSALARAKSNASKAFIEDIGTIENTLDYDLATDEDKLLDVFKTSTNMAQRVAFVNLMSKKGGPGIARVKEAVEFYENTNPAPADLQDFKELVRMNSAIPKAGKDLEFWLSNKRNANGDLETFKSLTNQAATWASLSASNFAEMNVNSQIQALKTLENATDYETRTAFNTLVENIGKSTFYGNLKPYPYNEIKRIAKKRNINIGELKAS